MATYTGGLKIDDAATKKYIDNVIAKATRKVKRIGLETVKELRRESTIKWFKSFGSEFANSASTMLASLDYEVEEHQKNGLVVLTFSTYINPVLYEIVHTRLYSQVQRGRYSVDPLDFIVKELQWGRGILGLPEESSQTEWVNPHFHQAAKSLMEYTYHHMKWSWIKRLHKNGLRI